MGANTSVSNIREEVSRRVLSVVTDVLLEQRRTVTQTVQRDQIVENVNVLPVPFKNYCTPPSTPGSYNIGNRARVDLGIFLSTATVNAATLGDTIQKAFNDQANNTVKVNLDGTAAGIGAKTNLTQSLKLTDETKKEIVQRMQTRLDTYMNQIDTSTQQVRNITVIQPCVRPDDPEQHPSITNDAMVSFFASDLTDLATDAIMSSRENRRTSTQTTSDTDMKATDFVGQFRDVMTGSRGHRAHASVLPARVTVPGGRRAVAVPRAHRRWGYRVGRGAQPVVIQ